MALLTIAMVLVYCLRGSLQSVYHYDQEVNLVKQDDRSRIAGFQNRAGKDIVLGGLFTVHYNVGGINNGMCGSSIQESGIDRMEAMLYAIDSINSDASLLPNLTLGYDIRDTCKRGNVALDETIDLLFSNNLLNLDSCHSEINKNNTLVSVIIGPAESSTSASIAGILQVVQIPQISYASTSTALNDRELYGYFYRTIPPDDQQARAMVDLMESFNWDHISVVYSNDLYGQRGIERVLKEAEASNICIDLNDFISDEFKTSDYTYLAKRLLNSTSNVVVLFAAYHHVRSLLTQLVLQTERKQFIWIASDSWAELTDDKFNEITAGKFGFVAYNENFDPFDDYYAQLSPSNNKRNPWFTKFYQQYYTCNNSSDCGNKTITEEIGYRQNSKVPLVIDAVYSAAHAIQNFTDQNCNTPLIWYPNNQSCQGKSGYVNVTLTGERLLEYIRKVEFLSPTNNYIKFDELGNVIAKYSIYNYQVTNHSTYRLVKVGYWDESAQNDRLYFYPNVTKQFGLDENGTAVLEFQIMSQCQQCSPGFIKRSVTSSCCVTCLPCLGQNYSNYSITSTQCEMCPQYMWGNNSLNGSTGCINIPETYLKHFDAWSIVLMILAIMGLLSVVFVSVVFIRFWSTPIVKSSGREQMTLILIGITLCFVITIVFILKPSIASCALQRIGTWFCFSLVFSAILVKLIRITRIFLKGQPSTSTKFISPPFQILFTFIFVSVQMVLVLVSLLVVHPGVNKVITSDSGNQLPLLVLHCNLPHIAMVLVQVAYCTLLIVTSNALAILTIKLPQNFNESRYVAFSTFSLGVIWMAFIFIYFAIVNAQALLHLPAVTSMTIQLSGIAVLVCLFGPRVFIMIVWPKLNVISTTTTMSTTSTIGSSITGSSIKN